MVKSGVKSNKPTLKNFAMLIAGIYQSRSVSMGNIAAELAWETMIPSVTRRLNRLLKNPRVRVRRWYRPIAENLLCLQAKSTKEVRLIVDGTKIGNKHQLLMVGIAFRRRAFPIAWTWVRHAKGHTSARVHLALLSYVRKLIPSDAPVVISGDAEFGNIRVMEQAVEWGWSYVFRIKSNYTFKLDKDGEAEPLATRVTKPGQSCWLGKGYLTAKAFVTNVCIEWKRGEKDPWILATNLPDQRTALKVYARRMWIEGMFGDLKSNGFDLERTKLRHFQRLSRLTLAVVLLHVWLMSLGTRTIKNGKRKLVDRSDRRDLSVFRIGLRMSRLMWSRGQLPKITFIPYF